jgi:hypothetical protein
MTEEYPTASEFIRKWLEVREEYIFIKNKREGKDYWQSCESKYKQLDQTYIHKDNNAEITKRYFALNPDAEAKILEKYKDKISKLMTNRIVCFMCSCEGSEGGKEKVREYELLKNSLLEELK